MGLNFNPATISPDAIKRLLLTGGNPSSMFNGDPSQPPAAAPGAQPTPPPSGTLAASMSPAAPTPPPTPEPTTPSGTISAALTPPPSKADYLATNPAATPARPRGPFDKIPDGQPGADTWGNRHNDVRHGLAAVFAGMQEFGRPGQGFDTVNHWEQQEQAKRDYDAKQPAMKQEAENQQYSTALGQQQTATGIQKEQAEIPNIRANIPMLQRQQALLDKVRTLKESGKYASDGDLFNAVLPEASTIPGMTRQQIVDAINSSKALGAKYTLTRDPQTQAPIELVDRQGNHYSQSNLPQDPEAKQMWNDASTAATGKEQIEEGKEKRVAGYAADRQAQAFSNQQQMEATKKMQPAVDTALTADDRLARMEKSYTKGVAGDQQAQLALLADHLGMTFGMQKGAKLNRGLIEEAQQSQPWLAKIGAKFDDKGYLSGVALGPEQMKQMLDLGYDARDRAWQGAHNSATTYGVPLPPGAEKVEQQRKPGSKPLLQQQGGQGSAQQKTATPQGATHIGVSSLDGKKYYLDAQGKKLGPAE